MPDTGSEQGDAGMNPKQRHFVLLCAAVAVTLGTNDAVAVVNGTDDFSHRAVGAILVYEPGSPRGDWVAHCSGFLIHPRVMLTAGHCVQQIQAALDAGVYLDARVSFQQSPFDPATFVEGDPEASGWLAIDEIVNNPDNPDWLNIPEIQENWGTWHDQGALILTEPVTHIRPLRVPWIPGVVEFVMRIRCEFMSHKPGLCRPLIVGYGLQGPPPPPSGELQRRRSVVTSYQGIDSLFVHTRGDPGDACAGDSGGAMIMETGRRGHELVVAILSGPANPFPFPPDCTGGSIQYRLDTESSIRFMWDVIFQAEFGHHGHRGPPQ